ncbi:TetR/AcrR family transcriptional regulator [Pedobacter paludis]|uniref:HTH tetR-type domain-containing protein n=1 Tax=Pedobacter paludis TaxID=2203212 RepID=A0A317F1Y2_9SPHI|nr:TetR/AcrR family transcriptional regulator [Pedobacter paludis]PWS33184.1 hypothetical protein DF947_00670 [Pedobacter paludis]
MKSVKEKVVDRRIKKTKKSLTEALISLILEQGYEKVTVQNIIDRANVGRSTFYIHYEGKEQLLLDGHNNLNVKMFSDDFDDDQLNNDISFVNLFEHILENERLAKAMLGKQGGNMMTVFFRNSIALKIKKHFKFRFGSSKIEQKLLTYLSDATGAAIVSLLVSWLEDDMPFTANEMSIKCKMLVTAIFA